MKPGLRVFAVAESFRRDMPRSVYVGVVMRGDMVMEGVVVGSATVGGLDSTDAILSMYRSLGRADIGLVMLDGCILSWYNIVDVGRLRAELGLPIICLVFEDPAGRVEAAVRRLFPDAEERLRRLAQIGGPKRYVLPGGAHVYVRAWGMDEGEAYRLVRRLAVNGKRPEPVRIARMIARAVLRTWETQASG